MQGAVAQQTMHDTLVQEWRRRMASRSMLGALLLSVPVLAAAAIGVSAGPGGLPFGISTLANGPSGSSVSAGGDQARRVSVSRLVGSASSTNLAVDPTTAGSAGPSSGGSASGAGGGGSPSGGGGGSVGGGSGGGGGPLVESTGSPTTSGAGTGSGSTSLPTVPTGSGDGNSSGLPTLPIPPSSSGGGGSGSGSGGLLDGVGSGLNLP
jgi:hypothetical protein